MCKLDNQMIDYADLFCCHGGKVKYNRSLILLTQAEITDG